MGLFEFKSSRHLTVLAPCSPLRRGPALMAELKPEFGPWNGTGVSVREWAELTLARKFTTPATKDWTEKWVRACEDLAVDDLCDDLMHLPRFQLEKLASVVALDNWSGLLLQVLKYLGTPGNPHVPPLAVGVQVGELTSDVKKPEPIKPLKFPDSRRPNSVSLPEISIHRNADLEARIKNIVTFHTVMRQRMRAHEYSELFTLLAQHLIKTATPYPEDACPGCITQVVSELLLLVPRDIRPHNKGAAPRDRLITRVREMRGTKTKPTHPIEVCKQYTQVAL